MVQISDDSSFQHPRSTGARVRRKTAVEAAAEDRARLRLSLETGNLFTWEVDEETGLVGTSSNAESVLGFRPGATVTDVLAATHPDDRNTLIAQFEHTVRQGSKFDAEFRIVSPQRAGIVWVQAQGVLLDDDSGGSHRVIGISQNITDRKQRELNAGFLLQLSDTIRPLGDAIEIQRVTTHLLGRFLGANRVIYSDIRPDGIAELGPHHVDGVDRLPTQMRINAFDSLILDQLATGRTVVRADVHDDPDISSEQRAACESIDLRAHVDVPLVKDGQLVAVLAVHQAQPRHWTSREVEIIEETAERTWSSITRSRAEQQLRQSEDRYRTLFETINEGFCVIEVEFADNGAPTDYRFKEVNPAFERHTGLTNALGKTAREMVPNLEQHWFDLYGGVAATGEPIRFVQHAEEMGGRWFDVHAFRIGEPEKRQVALLFRDISESRRTEAALRASEERLRRAIEIETVGVIFFEPDGPVTFANEAFLRMSGYTREDVENGLVRWDTMTPPEWMDVSTRAINDAFMLDRSTPYEKQYVRKNGSRWSALSYASKINDSEGVKFIIDITRSKQAEVERERLAAIVENSRDAVIGIDINGFITDWNPAATELYGYTAREAVGRSVEMLFPPDRLHERSGIIEKLQRQEDIAPYETIRLHKDGSAIEVEIRPSPVLDVAGRVVGGAVITRDATARKRLERAQEDFLAMASHDLRSPVTVISGRAQMMKRRKTYDEAGVDTILEQSQRVERLVTDLQELVKFESGEFEPDLHPVEIGSLAHQAVERARIQAAGRDIRIEVSADAVTGRWDPYRLGQILDNLIGNALKYSPEDASVLVQVDRQEGEARLSVIDTGPGIPTDALPHLFDRFYRVDKANSAAGLGLGLYITRMLVEAHGGRIWAESEVGQGCTFTVALPLEPGS